jgi:hypothetical protein
MVKESKKRLFLITKNRLVFTVNGDDVSSQEGNHIGLPVGCSSMAVERRKMPSIRRYYVRLIIIGKDIESLSQIW